MLKVFIDYIHTIDIYLIELIETDSENNVLSCLEKYEVNNVNEAVDACLNIQDKYESVTFYTESVLFDFVILTRARCHKKILDRYIR